MKKMSITATTLVVMAAAALGGYFVYSGGEGQVHAEAVATPTITQEQGKVVKTFELVAKETNWKLGEGKEIPAWTYNGIVPGSQIRVQQGDLVRVLLKNELKEPVSIHWHGYPVPNEMDGIPGMTQNAVQPGKTFTYEFAATIPGTYWYHSHQDSANQVDKGLYGTFIVEASEDKTINRDYTLVLDEWVDPAMGDMGHGNMDGMDHGNMNGMDHGNMDGMDHGNMNGMDHGNMGSTNQNQTVLPGPASMQALQPGAMHDEMMKMMYTIFTVNGKSGKDIEPLEAAKGDRVRLRFVNAGFQSHQIHLHDQPYRIVSVDGQPVKDPQLIQDQPLNVAPGERYDVEFTVTSERNSLIESHDQVAAAKQMVIPIQVKGAAATTVPEGKTQFQQAVDLSQYGGSGQGSFTLTQNYDVTYQMDLGEKQGQNEMDAVFTINGKAYAEVPPLQVKKGDRVLVTMTNKGSSDHPMHLHGHFFQVLSKDGKPYAGAPIMKDTLNVKPGETYVVAFAADNPGDWMFHCHDLHHAAAGMVSEVKYQGYQSFVPDPNAGNKPE